MKFTAPSVIFLAICLSACNSNNKTNIQSQDEEPEAVVSVSGTVSGDYLVNARVCADYNHNMSCDAGEPSTLSKEYGSFTLANILQRKVNETPLIMEATTDTIYESTGDVVEVPYRLSSPAGCSMITPLTTLAQYFVESGMTTEEAYQRVQQTIMTEQSICSDYIAQSLDDTSEVKARDEYKYLHRFSNLSAVVLTENLKVLESHFQESPISYQAMNDLIIDHQLSIMPDFIRAISYSYDTDQQSAEQENYNPAPQVDPLTIARQLTMISPSYNMTDVSLLRKRKVSGNEINIVDRYINSDDTQQSIFKLNELYTNEEFALGYSSYISDIRPSDSPEDHTGHIDYFNWNSRTGGYDRGESKSTSFQYITNSGFRDFNNNFAFYGYIPNPKDQQTANWVRLNRASLNGTFGELDNQQIRLLHEDNNGNLPSRLDDGISLILKAREFDISNKHVSSLLNIQPQLSLWNQIAHADSRLLSNAKAVNLTTIAGSTLFGKAPEILNQCESGQQNAVNCSAVSVLRPSVSGATLSGHSGRFGFSLSSDNSHLGSITPYSRLHIPSLPILFSFNNKYVSVFLSANGRAHFYQVSESNYAANRYETELSSTPGVILSRSPVVIKGGFAVGSWKRVDAFGLETVAIEIPYAVQRLEPDLPSKIGIGALNGQLQFISLYEYGDTIFESIVVDRSVLDSIVRGIDQEKLYRLYLQR